jgi:hypothetical protein
MGENVHIVPRVCGAYPPPIIPQLVPVLVHRSGDF